MAFLSNLVSAQTVYLCACLKMVASHFTPSMFCQVLGNVLDHAMSWEICKMTLVILPLLFGLSLLLFYLFSVVWSSALICNLWFFFFQREWQSVKEELISQIQTMKMKVRFISHFLWLNVNLTKFSDDVVIVQIFPETLIAVIRLCSSSPDTFHRKSTILSSFCDVLVFFYLQKYRTILSILKIFLDFLTYFDFSCHIQPLIFMMRWSHHFCKLVQMLTRFYHVLFFGTLFFDWAHSETMFHYKILIIIVIGPFKIMRTRNKTFAMKKEIIYIIITYLPTYGVIHALFWCELLFWRFHT